MRRRLFTVAPLLIGVGLLALTVLRADLRPLAHLTRQLGAALVVALLPGAVWHLLRTIAWQWSFPIGGRPSFARLARVRLAAEAFSFVTIRGVAGEPLKVVLLRGDVKPIVSAAAVALERVAYMFVTAAIVSVSAAAAMIVLPLTSGWMRAFGAIAGAGLVMVAVPVALLARHERVPRTHAAPTTPSSSRRGAIVLFVVQLGAQFRELVSGDRRRLLALVALETAAYLMMVAEVWAALRLTHLPITGVDALAVETFTRVASMASAFIPANLGALEASNVAAAFAVHAAGGAAALALVRRLRGLFWCAVGFMIYPRTHARLEPAPGAGEAPDQAARARRADGSAATLVVLEHAAPDVTISHHLGGLPLGERILRAAARGRFACALVWSPSQSADWNMLAARLPLALTVAAENDENAWRLRMDQLDPFTPVTVVAPGVIASPQTLTAEREVTGIPIGPTGESYVFRMPPHCARSPTALAEALAIAEGSARLASDGSAHGDGALVLPARTLAELASAEDRLRASVFKATDGVFGRFNRRFSLPVSIALIRWMRFNANAMTVLLLALGLYGGWLFSRGDYASGVMAALVSWIASVLDGSDGELARLQYTDSAFGCWLDTFGDYMYYLAIFGGLTVGAVRHTGWAGFWHIGAVLFVGALLTCGLLILLRDRMTAGRPEQFRRTAIAHFHGAGKRWARFVARLAPCATRATMPYGILAFALIDQLHVVLLLAAIGAQIYWISLSVELRRLLEAPRLVAP